ncbi:peptidase S8 [Actinomyces viscosus]|uniref:Thermitase n=1 Tax=Actinomyces viscosus TaxID=1656 RepID=A0A448PMM4_ACTVI|nr:S8 family serine peptidase [Actinomyces viscosus]TFH52415.1 peptidase S8 [Actinomyces viscosus]VEI17203.1 Thermitase [Actinomyces viscosus]
MKYSPRALAICVLAVVLLAAFPIMGMASFASSSAARGVGAEPKGSLVPRFPVPRPSSSPTPEPAPSQAPAETTAPETPSPTPEPEPEPEASAAQPAQTGAPPISVDVADCQRGQGSLLPSAPPVFKQIGVEQAWSVSEGQGVVVAVVDSGVDATNPHLQGAMAPGIDLLGRGDGQVDEDGHGTAVAGMIAARQVEGSGVVGIAKSATIMPVRVYQGVSDDQVKKGVGPTPARTAQGIQWAADNGAKVIVVGHMLTQDEPEVQAAVNQATAAGAIVVAGAGAVDSNGRSSGGATASTAPPATDANGAEVRYPAAYSNVLGVTSLDATGGVSKEVLHGSHVDVAVPAQAVPTTFFDEGDCLVSQNRPSPSLAAGYAAGVAALVVAAHPGETPADWKYRLTATAIRPEPATSSPATGWGLIAPYAALNFVNDGTAVGPENPRGAHPVPTPSPSSLKPIVPDPAPGRRARLAGATGAVGMVALALGLVASRVRGRKQP